MCATARQNQQYGQCAQRTRRSVWASASAQSDQSSLCAQWVVVGPILLHADSEDPDQAGRMPSLIWAFPGRIGDFVRLSCCGAFDLKILQAAWLKKSSLMVIMLPLITVCCYRISADHFAQSWTLCNDFVSQPDVLQKNRVYTIYPGSLS